jgi:hypothetical protein
MYTIDLHGNKPTPDKAAIATGTGETAEEALEQAKVRWKAAFGSKRARYWAAHAVHDAGGSSTWPLQELRSYKALLGEMA